MGRGGARWDEALGGEDGGVGSIAPERNDKEKLR